MARNIFKDYLDYDKNFLKEYINTITEKKINSKICDMIVDTYINIRYFNNYEPVKATIIDNIEYYVVNNYIRDYIEKDKKKNAPYIVESLILIRYIMLLERESDKRIERKIKKLEEGIKEKYENTNVIIVDLIKTIKDNIRKKGKFVTNLSSNDFSLSKKSTDKDHIYEVFLDNSIKIPDLYSEIAINRVYNTGIIYEDRMLVLYLLTVRELLIDSISRNYDNKYLLPFPISLLEKRNKQITLLKTMEQDYLKERMILEVNYSDYKNNKEQFDKLIHDGYSFAVVIDEDIDDSLILLNVFSYILLNEKADKKKYKDFDNVINI